MHHTQFTLFAGIDMSKTSFFTSIVDEHFNYVKRENYSVDTLYTLALTTVGCSSIELQYALTDILDDLVFFTDKLERNTRDFISAVKNYFLEAFTILTSIPGIADISASHLIAEIGDISRFASAKRLIAYAGTDPGIEQSGISIDRKKHISKRGNQHLRRVIYLAASSVLIIIPYSLTIIRKNVKKISSCIKKLSLLVLTSCSRLSSYFLQKKSFFD